MIKIPNEQNQFRQANSSEKMGNIYRTKNISFDREGYISLANATRALVTSAQFSNIGSGGILCSEVSTPNISPTSTDPVLWTAGMGNMYESTFGTSNQNFPRFNDSGYIPGFAGFGRYASMVNTSYNHPTDPSLAKVSSTFMGTDMEIVVYRDNFGWDDFMDINDYGQKEVVQLLAVPHEDQLVVAFRGDEPQNQASSVALIDKDKVIRQTLDIIEDYEITGITYNSERYFISTQNRNGDPKSILIEWDGLANTANAIHTVNSLSIMAIHKYKQGAVFVTSDGELGYVFGGVQMMDKFPVWEEQKEWFTRTNPQNRIPVNGIQVDKDLIYICVDSELTQSSNPNEVIFRPDFISGVWCYDPRVGLHHKYSIGQSRVLRTNNIAPSSINTTTNTITVAGVTVPETGTPLYYKASTLLGTNVNESLKEGVKYYTIKVSDTQLKVARSKQDALDDIEINLTDPGFSHQHILFFPNYDFGGAFNKPKSINRLNKGTLTNVGSFLLDKWGIGGQQPIGSTSFNRSSLSVTQQGIENRGYFITPIIESSQVKDDMLSFTIKWQELKEGDEIIIKYRDTKRDGYLTRNTPYFVLIDSNKITTIQDLSDVKVGDEIEIVAGAGAGYLAHITDISENAGLYTVEFDEHIENWVENDRGLAVFSNWQKISTITSKSEDNSDGVQNLRIGDVAKWGQFKVELRGVDVAVESVVINNKINSPII